MCDTPPLRLMKITRFARGEKCGRRGAKGSPRSAPNISETNVGISTAPAVIVREHYRIAFGLRPTSEEARFWQERVAQATSDDERRAVLEDFVWGLLSSSEFQTNH